MNSDRFGNPAKKWPRPRAVARPGDLAEDTHPGM
jgi:hypothetical protein